MIGYQQGTRLPRLDIDADINVGGGAVIGAGLSSVLDTQVGGDLEIVGGGKIKGAGTIQILPTGAYYTQIGDAGAPGHLGTPTNDDCFVAGRLETDGMAYMDGGATITQLTTSGDWYSGGIIIGVGGVPQAYFVPHQDDGLFCVLTGIDGRANHNLIITSHNNWAKNHRLSSLSPHPTVHCFSNTDPSSGNVEDLRWYHDTTQGHIRSGMGPIEFSAPAAAPTLANNGSFSVWINEATHTLNVRAKYSDGTVKNLTTPLALS